MIRCSHIPKGKRRPDLVQDLLEGLNPGTQLLANLLYAGAWSRVTLTHAETGDTYIYEIAPPTPEPSTNGHESL